MNTAIQIARLVVVLALLCVAAAIATPKGRLPLAFRGLAKMLGKDGIQTSEHSDIPVSPARRLLAFLFVLLAALLALI